MKSTTNEMGNRMMGIASNVPMECVELPKQGVQIQSNSTRILCQQFVLCSSKNFASKLEKNTSIIHKL